MKEPSERLEHQDLADALDTLHRLGATGMIQYEGLQFQVHDQDTINRENRPGSNSPYISIIDDTPVITRADFYNYVADFHSEGLTSSKGQKIRAGNAWTHQATVDKHKRGIFDWSVKQPGSFYKLGSDPRKVIEFFSPYRSADEVPRYGLLIGPGSVGIWYDLARYLGDLQIGGGQ
jgi:hypothetical protein